MAGARSSRRLPRHERSAREVEPDELWTSRRASCHVGNLGFHPLMEQTQRDGSSGWSRLLAAAQAAGLHTNLELATLASERLEQVVGPCLPHLDSVIINELERQCPDRYRSVSARRADAPVDWAVMEALAQGLIERGVSSLAVVHFPAGAVAAMPGGQAWRQGSVRLRRIRSSARLVPATRSHRASSTGCTRAGPWRPASDWAPPLQQRASEMRTRRTASAASASVWPWATVWAIGPADRVLGHVPVEDASRRPESGPSSQWTRVGYRGAA